MMDEFEKRMVIYDDRIDQLEDAVSNLTDSVLKMEAILDELANILIPDERDGE